MTMNFQKARLARAVAHTGAGLAFGIRPDFFPSDYGWVTQSDIGALDAPRSTPVGAMKRDRNLIYDVTFVR